MICDKTRYDTYKAAQQAIMHITMRKKRNPMKVYKCNDCGGFHITTVRHEMRRVKNEKYKADYTNVKPVEKKEIKVVPMKKEKGIETTYRPFAYLKAK